MAGQPAQMNATLASGLHYAISIGGPLTLIALAAPASLSRMLLAGLLGWFAASFAEYALHRYVMHGMRRFAPAHALHHARPPICNSIRFPTLLHSAFRGRPGCS